MTVGWRVNKRDRTFGLLVTRGQLSRLLTFLSVCWNPELTSRWLFPLLSKTAQQPLLLDYTELSKMLPTTNPKEQTPLPQGFYGAYHRISPSRPFPIPSTIANVHTFFQNNLHPSPHYLMYKEVLDHQYRATETLHFPLALQMVVSTSCPRTWSSFSCQQ